jgi:hypothetical protein
MVSRSSRALARLCPWLLAAFAACKPEFSERPSEVQSYRVLAVQAEPAEWQRILDPDTNEAKPASYRALVVNPLGTVANAELEWAFCTMPKPLTELNDVSIQCFQNDPAFIIPLGKGPAATAAIPENTCRQFGPDIPENAAFRPADPDVSGGYYQPLRVLYRPQPDQLVPTMAKVRIRCGLAGASQEQSSEYNRKYHVNTNPKLETVAVDGRPLASLESDPAAPPFELPRGGHATLRGSWPSCPTTDACGDGFCGPTETNQKGEGQCEADCTTPKACGGAERYLVFRLETRTLDVERESMRVSWFTAGGGSFRDDRTGRDGSDTATFTENELTAPEAPGTYPMWIVLRDGRGGSTWASYRFVVR